MSHSLHRLRNLVLDSYIDAHPDLRELYHTDSITNQVMQQCACTGLAPVVMLFHLAKAQLTARQAVEKRFLDHLERSPVVSFFVPPGSTPAPKS